MNESFGFLLWVFLFLANPTNAAKQPARKYEAAECYRGKSVTNRFYSHMYKDIDGGDVDFQKYRGKVSLVVNVASFWALTNATYIELNALVQKYGPNSMKDTKSKGDCSLHVLGFPSNQVSPILNFKLFVIYNFQLPQYIFTTISFDMVPSADTGKKLTSSKFPGFPILINISPIFHNVSPKVHF